MNNVSIYASSVAAVIWDQYKCCFFFSKNLCPYLDLDSCVEIMLKVKWLNSESAVNNNNKMLGSSNNSQIRDCHNAVSLNKAAET